LLGITIIQLSSFVFLALIFIIGLGLYALTYIFEIEMKKTESIQKLKTRIKFNELRHKKLKEISTRRANKKLMRDELSRLRYVMDEGEK
jgi:hypothetical protein